MMTVDNIAAAERLCCLAISTLGEGFPQQSDAPGLVSPQQLLQ